RLTRSGSEITLTNIGNCGSSGISVTDRSRPTLSQNTITSCSDHGIAISESAMPIVLDNLIYNCSDYGIHMNAAGSSLIKGNLIDLAGVRGISIWETNTVRLERNVVFSSQGVGIWIYRSNGIVLLNNTILYNSGHGVHLSVTQARMVNNLIFQCRGAGVFADRSEATLLYNDLWNNNPNYNGIGRGENDISENPQLIDPGRYNFWPSQGSPVIDAGDPTSPLDPDGTRADIGAFFFNQNHPPIITSVEPESLDIAPGDRQIIFRITAEDPDGHPLTAIWSVNGTEEGRGFTFPRIFNRDGIYEVVVTVDDGYYEGTTSHTWRFQVIGSEVSMEPFTPYRFSVSSVYPNPFNSQIQIKVFIPHPGIITGELWTIEGKKISAYYWNQMRQGEITLNPVIPSIPSGVYILTLTYGSYKVPRILILSK
ncbi:MAG: right-handed parallel beta-helix repeat-containing protein, partial [bacterium]